MKIKIYVNFYDEEVMTEAEHEVWLKEQVDDMMTDSGCIEDTLDTLNVTKAELFSMDGEDFENLRERVREEMTEGLDGHCGIQEFEVEV